MKVATPVVAPAVKNLQPTHTIMTRMGATVNLLRVVNPDTMTSTNIVQSQSNNQKADAAPLDTRTSCLTKVKTNSNKS